MSDYDESRDLDPDTPGVQNPFDPADGDSTGDDFSPEPDGLRDGRNDWDGDGMNNADEFTWGFNPTDPTDPASVGNLPATSAAGCGLTATLIALAETARRFRRR